MSKRYFVFGLGVGLIILPLMFYFVFSLEYKKTQSVYAAAQEPASDDEIVERAEKMGMVFVKDLPSETAETAETEPVVREMSEAEMLDGLSDEAIIGRAIELGLVRATDEALSTEELEEPIEAGALLNNMTEATRIDIPVGASSATICKILEDAGVVENADELVQYFNERQVSHRLIQGNYEFEKGVSFEEILKMISYVGG